MPESRASSWTVTINASGEQGTLYASLDVHYDNGVTWEAVRVKRVRKGSRAERLGHSLMAELLGDLPRPPARIVDRLGVRGR